MLWQVAPALTMLQDFQSADTPHCQEKDLVPNSYVR